MKLRRNSLSRLKREATNCRGQQMFHCQDPSLLCLRRNMSKNGGLDRKVAVVACHQDQVCLVTTRQGGRWVLPKGKIKRGRTAREMALQEAWEEAGLVGTIRDDPVLTCLLKKSGRHYQLTTFVMDVRAIAKRWPEKRDRKRRWFSPIEAVQQVHNDQLRHAILQSVTQPATDSWTQFLVLLNHCWTNLHTKSGCEVFHWSLQLQHSPSGPRCFVTLQTVANRPVAAPAASETSTPETGSQFPAAA